MQCQKCGMELPENATSCPACDNPQAQQDPSPQPPDRGPITCGPFYFPRNQLALWSYYLGWATPFFCAFAGIPALVTGICALVYARHHPEGGGAGHAVFGIVMGSIAIAVSLFGLIGFLISIVS